MNKEWIQNVELVAVMSHDTLLGNGPTAGAYIKNLRTIADNMENIAKENAKTYAALVDKPWKKGSLNNIIIGQWFEDDGEYTMIIPPQLRDELVEMQNELNRKYMVDKMSKKHQMHKPFCEDN